MKYWLFIPATMFLLISCIHSKRTAAVQDSFINRYSDNQVSSDSIEALFIHARDNPVKSQFVTEKILMSNGQHALIATSDNNKTKSIISQYPNISPVQFLLGLSNIEGEIRMYTNANAKVWVGKRQVDSLFKISGSPIITPTITGLTNDYHFPPDTIFNLLYEKPRGDYLKMPLGHNALCLIYAHITGYYPSANYESADKIKSLIKDKE